MARKNVAKRYVAPSTITLTGTPEQIEALGIALHGACRSVTLSCGTEFLWNPFGDDGAHLVRFSDGKSRREAALLAELAMCKRFADVALLADFVVNPFKSETTSND